MHNHLTRLMVVSLSQNDLLGYDPHWFWANRLSLLRPSVPYVKAKIYQRKMHF
jgi:hypothetical protein